MVIQLVSLGDHVYETSNNVNITNTSRFSSKGLEVNERYTR
jgi:hypothetical protein